MEEKNKNIIYSIIAILLGIIVGGCTQVKAEENVIPNLAFRIYQNSNWQNVTTESNAWVAPGNVLLEVGSSNSKIGGDGTLPPYIWVRMCQQNENLRATDISTLEFGIGTAESARLIYTTTPCTPVGTDYKGVQVVAEWGISNGNGYECYVDLEINNHVCNINTAMAFTVDQYGGYGEVYFGYSYQTLSISDAEKIVEEGIGTLVEQNQIIIETQQETNEKLNEIINSGEFKKPEKDEILKDYEEKEEELWSIIGIPNYNDLNIDIDSNTNSKIWNLIVYILNQNTAILTMIITILSISILKLILNR